MKHTLKHGMFTVALMFLFSFIFSTVLPASVNYIKKSANDITLYILEINISSEKIIPVSASGMDYGSKFYADESFGSMAKRAGAVGAINGCYFDKATLKPVGDVAVNGARLHNGGGWAYFGVKNDGSLEFGTDNPVQSRVDWSGFQWGITCLPMVIKNGAVLINSNEDLSAAGFHDSHVFMKMPRSALGETKDGKIVLVASGNTTFPAFAKALKEIGVVNAIGLDGGASTALYWNGKTILSPGRKLTTILAVVKGTGVPAGTKKIKTENTETQTQKTSPDTSTESTPPVETNTNESTPAVAPGGMECNADQWFKDTPLSCENCKIIIKSLKDSNEGAMTACVEIYCKEKFPNCK